jgi:7,8-dihydro-6-hydroxymethylpterin-pyrophosphokinase
MLEPLAEIAPGWLVPPDGVPVRELLSRLSRQGDTTVLERIDW